MKEESRTKNSILNISTGAIVQIINKLMAFAVRTVFIKMLNSEYLGVNGLFTNILSILSFAELGIGTAIIFNMYKPVAEDDIPKIKSLMYLYKKSYNVIGIVIFLLGLCVIPFMGIIVKDTPNIEENIILIYVLFLINTSMSYFFTYKKSIISAHQKEIVINKIDSIFYICKSIVEIIFLVLFRNYIVYLIIGILATFTENMVLAYKANKMYPYLKEKDAKELDKKEKKGIMQNVKSLVIYKIGGVIMNGTDNILISSMINVTTVGYCSNYTLIINAVTSIVTSALNGLTASVGNLNAVGDKKRKEEIFYLITFANFLIYSFCTVAFIILLNPFIRLWLGSEFVLGIDVSIALAASTFINGLRMPAYTYRVTMGLFSKGKSAPYIGAITNIIFSIILCNLIGVSGIFWGTYLAQLVSYSWIDPYLIHKYEFKTNVVKYFKKLFFYILICIIDVIVTMLICDFIFDGILGFILKCLTVLIVPNLINLIVFNKSEEFKSLKTRLIEPIINKLKNANC